MTTARLQHIDSDFIQCLKECEYTQDQLDAVADAEGSMVEVLCNATDYYWNIKLPCGMVLEAISGHNLSGLEDIINFD